MKKLSILLLFISSIASAAPCFIQLTNVKPLLNIHNIQYLSEFNGGTKIFMSDGQFFNSSDNIDMIKHAILVCN